MTAVFSDYFLSLQYLLVLLYDLLINIDSFVMCTTCISMPVLRFKKNSHKLHINSVTSSKKGYYKSWGA